MKIAETILNSPLLQCAGWTLVHFIWQGIAIGVIYIGLRRLLSRQSPASRYHLAMCCLAVMALLPVITFIHLANISTGVATDTHAHALTAVLTTGGRQDTATVFSIMDRIQDLLRPIIPWTVPLWLLGVCAAMMRIARGWRHSYEMRETATYVPLQEWYPVLKSLCALFGISAVVRLAVSTRVSVPSVVGWLKPIILIPPSAIAGLSPLQMELILAHELAHIRRQDYLWNLMQLAVETLLFYHPVVHWISQQGRLEREQCCDDMVVAKHGHVVEYARALTELESLRHAHSALLLGANGGHILNRIHRLLGVPVPEAPVFWLPLMLIAGFLISASLMQFSHQELALQSIVSTKYSLMADVKQSDLPVPVKSSSYRISPTRINLTAGMRVTDLKPLHLTGTSSGIALEAPPSLANAISPVEPTVVPPAPAAQPVTTPPARPAAIIEMRAPTYPALPQQRGIEGSATVEFTLTAEGDITHMHVTHVSGSRLFGQAAVNALRHWKISPATIAGVPIAQRMTEEFTFELKSSTAHNGRCVIPMGYHVCTAD
jgi:bla regulator protein blaR1